MIALALPVLNHIEHRRMLHPCCDQVALFRLGLEGGPDGRIVALRAAGGENDFIRTGPQQGGDAFAGRVHGFAHLAAEAVHAGRVAVEFAQIGQHGREHFRGHGRGGVVVEIDGLHGLSLLHHDVGFHMLAQQTLHQIADGHLAGTAV